MNVYQLPLGPMKNFCYIIEQEASKTAILVDPGWEDPVIDYTLKERKLNVEYIISTHDHYDHCQENDKLKKKYDCLVIAHEKAVDAHPDRLVKNGDTLNFHGIPLTFIHAPGHSEGGMLIKAGKNLFTGDTLFIGKIGRTDLPGSDPEKMKKTLEMIKKMDDDLQVLPGHDYGDVPARLLGKEKLLNPYLR